MWRGLYTAAAGMVQEMTRTDTIANNLANANTNGYKRDRAISREFEPMLIRRINDDMAVDDITRIKQFSVGGDPRPIVGTLGLGSYTKEIATDHEQGIFISTGNPLDVGISGNGYFMIETPQGVRYTRDGHFSRQPNGDLVTPNGQAVLNPQGRPITIPEEARDIIINTNGEIYADAVMVDQLGFVEFDDRRAVLKQGHSLYYAQEGANPVPATGFIEQGILERANTNVVSEMVDLINNYRVYEAGSKAVTTQDSMIDKSVNDVGRVS